jgi:hypothetical protein
MIKDVGYIDLHSKITSKSQPILLKGTRIAAIADFISDIGLKETLHLVAGPNASIFGGANYGGESSPLSFARLNIEFWTRVASRDRAERKPTVRNEFGAG